MTGLDLARSLAASTLPGLVPGLTRSTPVGGPGEPRVVLVTGATSGIGRATALRAAREGDHVALLARSEDTLAEVAVECRHAGAASTQVVVADVGDDDEVAKAVEAVLAEHDHLDAVLHCAGVVTYGRAEEVSPEDFAEVVTTNLLGSANVARHTIPVLRDQRQGVLVLVGSLLGHIGVPEMTPYVVSKWGVRALARQLAMENTDLPGVRIAHVAPGSVDTPIYDNALDSAGGVNSPPPPVISPERAAETVYRQVARPRQEAQTALSNYVLMAAFTLAPRLWDAVAGPAFKAVSRRASSDSPDGG